MHISLGITARQRPRYAARDFRRLICTLGRLKWFEIGNLQIHVSGTHSIQPILLIIGSGGSALSLPNSPFDYSFQRLRIDINDPAWHRSTLL